MDLRLHGIEPSLECSTALLIEHGPAAMASALATLMNHAMQIEREQVLSLTAFKANRDPATLAPALAAVEAAARGTDNLMPPILAAVKVGATVGEISNILRAVFGEYREALVL